MRVLILERSVSVWWYNNFVMYAKLLQSCWTLRDPMDCSPPGFSIYGIFQARILEWVAMPFSRASSLPRDQTQVFCIVGRFFTVWATREYINCIVSDNKAPRKWLYHSHIAIKIQIILFLKDLRRLLLELKKFPVIFWQCYMV